MPLSLPKQKIRVLLLEGVNDSAVRMFEANGYTEIERLPKALGSAELKRMLSGVHMLGIRSRTHLTEEVLQAADRLMAAPTRSSSTRRAGSAFPCSTRPIRTRAVSPSSPLPRS